MDIQGHIIDVWIGKTSKEHPIITVYDPEGKYYSLLPLVSERGVQVIDTTRELIHHREAACDYWMNELAQNEDARLLIYRKSAVPKDKERVYDPFIGMTQIGARFPIGPNDSYINLCKNFLHGKTEAIDELFKNGTASFANINALQEGVNYPELETLTGGKSMVEITLNLLALNEINSTAWMSEWKSFGENHLPGLDSNGTTLKDVKQKLWQYLLFSEFVHDLPGTLPAELNTVAKCPKENMESINNLCQSIRNRTDLRDDYVEQAQAITSRLHLDSLFADAIDLGKIVTFAFENKVEFNIYLDHLHKGEYTEATLLVAKNKKSVWYQADAGVALFWNLTDQCERMMQCIRQPLDDLDNLKNFVLWYSEEGYKVDYAFRRFQTILTGSDVDTPQINELAQFVYRNYRSFTEQIQGRYQKLIDEEGYPITGINWNIQAWNKEIAPLLNSHKRVAIIYADAFRFEMGKELAQSLENSYTVSIQPSAAYVPTVTRFGMAALLPDAESKLQLAVEEGKLQPYLEGKKVDLPTDRISYIESKVPAHVKLMDVRSEDFLSANVTSDVNLLIIRSQSIDAAGENLNSVGYSEMESEMRLFTKCIRACKNSGFDNVVIMADHGYMVQPKYQAGDNMSKPVGTSVMNERRSQAGDLNGNENSWLYTPEHIGVQSQVYRFAFAKQYGIYEKNKIYFHEGLSLQENIVPILTVQLTEERPKEAFSLELTYKGKNSGIVRVNRPLIELNFSGVDSLFRPELCIVKMVVTDASGKEVGRVVESTFYNETTDLIAIPSECDKCKQPIEINEGVEGDIIVMALDPDTNVTLASIQLQTEFDF